MNAKVRVLLLLAVVGLIAPNAKCDQELQATSALGSQVPLDVRIKAARKPFNYVAIDYMDVIDGQERNYLLAEAMWQEVHEAWAQQGKIIGWGLAKARKNDLGFEFVTWKIIESREDLVGLYNNKEIEKIVGSEKFAAMQEITVKSRTISGSEVLALVDYTLPGLSNGKLGQFTSFHIDYMTPLKGQHQEYYDLETVLMQPRHQKRKELDPRFIGWEFLQVVSQSGKVHPSQFRTTNIFDKNVRLTPSQEKSLDAKMQEAISELKRFPADYNLNDVRKMDRVTYDVVYMTDQTNHAVSKLWKELIGTWTAPSAGEWEKEKGGAYRRKTITLFHEKYELFDAEGNVLETQMKPMSIEIINDIAQFTIYPGNNTLSFPFKIKNGIWYENMRGLNFSSSNDPDFFYKYQKTENSVLEDESAFSKKPEDVSWVKAIIESYASGDIETYLSYFSKSATAVHNANDEIPISDVAERHRAHHMEIQGEVKILRSNYEVITTATGVRWGHAWFTLLNTYKTGIKTETAVFVSFGLNKDDKVFFENGHYDTASLPKNSVYSKE